VGRGKQLIGFGVIHQKLGVLCSLSDFVQISRSETNEDTEQYWHHFE